jgi:hypothetical protein
MIRGRWRFVKRIRQPGGDLYLFQYMGEVTRPPFYLIPVDYFWGKKPAAGGKG